MAGVAGHPTVILPSQIAAGAGNLSGISPTQLTWLGWSLRAQGVGVQTVSAFGLQLGLEIPQETQLVQALQAAAGSDAADARAREVLSRFVRDYLTARTQGVAAVPAYPGVTRFGTTESIAAQLNVVLAKRPSYSVLDILLNMVDTLDLQELQMLGRQFSYLRVANPEIVTLSDQLQSLQKNQNETGIVDARAALASYLQANPDLLVILLPLWREATECARGISNTRDRQRLDNRIRQLEAAVFIVVDQWIQQASGDNLVELSKYMNGSLAVFFHNLENVLALARRLGENPQNDVDQACNQLLEHYRSADESGRRKIQEAVGRLLSASRTPSD